MVVLTSVVLSLCYRKGSFLDSTCKWHYTLFAFLTYFTQYDNLWGEERVGMNWEVDISIYTLLRIKQVTSGRRRGCRGWDGGMASPTRRTWVWVGSGSWWWTGKPGVLQSMGSQSRLRLSDWTELIWMRTYCIAQGSLLSAPKWSKWEGNKKQWTYAYA